jgi:hypothetical protein
MTDPTQAAASADGVHRLIDMVVEEVSLVDRAANKHRFLIVKRNDAMDDDNDTTSPAPAQTPSAPVTPAPAEAAKLAEGSPLGAAVAALESLTAIVELLGSLGAQQSDTRLAALAQDLRATAEDLLARTGFASPDTEEEAGATPATPATPAAPAETVEARVKGDAPPPPAAPGAFAMDVTAAKRALTRLAELAAQAVPARAEKRADAPAASNGAPPLAESLAKLADSFRALSATVQEQQQRLGRVEKQFGLPNSSAHAEHAARPPEDVGWPLDLNHPMDRESVDKAVSFHDL